MAADTTWKQRKAGWVVEFDPETSRVECVHPASGARVAGELRFSAIAGEQETPWSIALPRDPVRSRLALVDPQNNAQGYLQLSGGDGALRILVVHRPRQAFRGVLSFTGTAELADAFACRTRNPERTDVVQMASGPADSALNDSLFDVESDTLLRFGGAGVALSSPEVEAGSPRAFDVRMTARAEDAGRDELSFELKQDDYRDRYVPYYRPIDRERCPSAPTGWMSWNVYFDTAGEKENLDEARVGARHLKPFGMEIWSIESWQADSDKLPVRDFDNLSLRAHPGQFPHGMKWLADEIRALGFTPGIWTAPFGTGHRGWYEEHREWFLHDAAGQPMSNWCGRYLLDPSQPAVRRHIREMHRVMSEEWGYEFFKIDGMANIGPSYSAHFYERPEVRAAFVRPCRNPYQRCVQALREGIGPDRVFLCCGGHFTGPEVAVSEATRLGGDVVSPNQPSKWHNVLSQASATLRQLFVHNIVWYGDPDTLLVGDFHPIEAARAVTTVVALPGSLMFAGDKLAELAPERMRLLQQALPVCDVRPLDLFPILEMRPVWDLKIRRPFAEWDVVSLFNWGDEEREVGFRFGELGLPKDGTYLVYNFWGRRFLGERSGEFRAAVPAHANLLLAVHRAAGRPQFLSTDRHVTQGGTCLKALAWDAETGVLSGSTELVGGHPSRLTFYLPAGCRFLSADADGAAMLDASVDGDGVLTVVLRSEASGIADWRVRTAAAT